MRKSIFTIAILALSFLNANATEIKQVTNNPTTTISSENIVEIYDWRVTTNTTTYSGTSTSEKEARKMIELVTVGEIILDRKIETFYVLASEISSPSLRLFFWEVETSNGKAKGFSSSECQAKKMIQLIGVGDITSFKILIQAEFK